MAQFQRSVRYGHHSIEEQKRFVIDIRAKLNRYGAKTRLSEKQIAKLYEILGPLPQPTNDPQNTKEPSGEVVVPIRQPQTRRQQTKRRTEARRSSPNRESRRQPDNRRKRSRTRFRIRDIILVVAIGIALVGAGQQFASRYLEGPSKQASRLYKRELSRADFTITDGDTIKIVGEQKGTRLVGFNTPETFEPRCQKGLELGRQATRRLRELVANAQTSRSSRSLALVVREPMARESATMAEAVGSSGWTAKTLVRS